MRTEEQIIRKNAARRKAYAERAALSDRTVRKWRLTPEEKITHNREKALRCKWKNIDVVRKKNAELARKKRSSPQGQAVERAVKAAYYAKHKDVVKRRNRDWYEKNKGVFAAKAHAYRARKNGVGGKHTAADIAALMVKQKGNCTWCLMSFAGDKPHVDHKVPLALGGSNDPSNLQLLHKSCNSIKGSKHPVQFAQQKGLLCW